MYEIKKAVKLELAGDLFFILQVNMYKDVIVLLTLIFPIQLANENNRQIGTYVYVPTKFFSNRYLQMLFGLRMIS